MANNEITLRIGADPTKLQSGLNRSSSAIKSFAGKARASFSAVTKSIGNINLGSVMGPLLIGGGLSYTVKEVGDFSRELMYYSMAAKKSDADTRVFRESLHDLAIQTGVDSKAILGGVAKIGEITGDFDYAEQMGGNLAKAANASGASVEDLASVASSLRATMGLTADETQKFFNSLIIQGDQGSFTLQKFAREGKALLAATSTHGVKTPEQFARFGAYLQVMNAQIKSEAELTTSVSSLFSELTAKAKDLNKIGVHVFNKNNEFNDFDGIMRQLMQKTGGNIQKLQKYFGASSIKALQPLIAEYKNGFETIQTIAESGLDGMKNTAELDKRNEKISKNFDKTVEKMKASAVKFADLNLAGPVETLSSALQTLSEHQTIVTTGFVAMTAAAGLVGLVKFGQTLKGGFDFIKGLVNKHSSKELPSNAIPFNPNDVQKVFVTNMGGGFGGSNYYMDDDDVPVKKSAENVAKSATPATKEMGRFGSAVSKARSGINKFGNNIFGGSLLTAATGWAMNKIYDFGAAFIEWRNVVADAEANASAAVSANDKTFREKYGSSAGHWSDKASAALLEAQKEGNSLFGSQKRIDQLMADFNRYSKLASEEIKKGTAAEYMQNMTVAPNIVINMDQWNNRYTAQSDGGKPAKVKLRNTPGMG